MSVSTSNEFNQDTTLLQSSSIKPQKKSKPPPLVLCSPGTQYWALLSPLAEFAAIATSPESPLVKETSCDNAGANNAFKLPCIGQDSLSNDIYTPKFPTCEVPAQSWSSSTIWERFNTNTRIQDGSHSALYPNFTDNTQTDERSTTKTSSLFRPHYLRDSEHEISNAEETTSFNRTPWSKFLTTNEKANSHGLPCRELLLGDVCIPLSSSKATKSCQNEPATLTTKIHDTKPPLLFDLDSAAHALSNMAKRKEEHNEYQRKLESTLQVVKRKGTRVRKRKNGNTYARRPMNAFMLFAKQYRLEITQKHPGKDNRAISVILGDKWKSMSLDDRMVYIVEAKHLAEEHKRIYPDCWKRKRTAQTSSRTNRKH